MEHEGEGVGEGEKEVADAVQVKERINYANYSVSLHSHITACCYRCHFDLLHKIVLGKLRCA